MRYAVRVPAEVSGVIAKLHPGLKRKLRAALDDLAERPELGKPLKDELANYRSLRIGRFRLIYRVAAERFVDLFAFGPREHIYEEMRRLIRRQE